MRKATLLGEWKYGEYNTHHLNVYKDDENYYVDNITNDVGLDIMVNGKEVNVIEMSGHLCPPEIVSNGPIDE